MNVDAHGRFCNSNVLENINIYEKLENNNLNNPYPMSKQK